MTRFYSDPSKANDTYSIPDCEVFYRTQEENKEYGVLDGDGNPMPSGWYWWTCFPGCMPDSEPFGPFKTEEMAIMDCRRQNDA